jgi:hypothetical protein
MNNISADRIARMMTLLSKSAKTVKQKEYLQQNITKKISDVKQNSDGDVRKELEQIESMLRELLKKEEKRYSPVSSQAEPQDIESMKRALLENIWQDGKRYSDYKRMLEDFEFNMEAAEQEEINKLNYAVDEIDRVNRTVSALNEKVGRIHHVESRRLEELEKRIRQDVQDNRKELLLIEQEIRGLERKSQNLKDRGELGEEAAKKIDNKIADLREKADVLKVKYPKSLMEEVKLIPQIARPAEISQSKTTPAPSMTELKIPANVSDGQNQSFKFDKLQEFKSESGRSIEEELMPRLEEEKLPPLVPEPMKDATVPPEFDAPRKLGFWQKFKGWLGFTEDKRENSVL